MMRRSFGKLRPSILRMESSTDARHRNRRNRARSADAISRNNGSNVCTAESLSPRTHLSADPDRDGAERLVATRQYLLGTRENDSVWPGVGNGENSDARSSTGASR